MLQELENELIYNSSVDHVLVSYSESLNFID